MPAICSYVTFTDVFSGLDLFCVIQELLLEQKTVASPKLGE